MNFKKFALVLIFVTFSVAGCQSSAGMEAGSNSESYVSPTSTAVGIAVPATDTPVPTPTVSPEPTSTPTFEEVLEVDNLSVAGEDIKELVTVLREAGDEVTFQSSDCGDMDEPYLVLTEGEGCKALSEFMVEDLHIYETTKVLLIFDGDVTLDDLHNPILLQEGKIGDYTFFAVDVRELRYIRSEYLSFAPDNFLRHHDILRFSEEELRGSFISEGKRELADKLANNLFLGCVVQGGSSELELYQKAFKSESPWLFFTDDEAVDSFRSMVENGDLDLKCDSEQTVLENLVGAFGVGFFIVDAIEDSTLATEARVSTEPIPTKEVPPFPEDEGTIAWEHFREIQSRIQERTGLALRADFYECKYPTTPWKELVVYQNGNECWAIGNIQSYGVEDADPETERTDYYAGLVLQVGRVHRLEVSGETYDCVESWEQTVAVLNMASFLHGPCMGRYAQMNMYTPESEYISESALGFNREAINAFNELDAVNGRGELFHPGYDKLGIVGLDKESYLFLSYISSSGGRYDEPFEEFDVKEIE